jgi:dipeptidase E
VPLLLTSTGLPGLAPLLRRLPGAARCVLVPNAADALPDGPKIVAAALRALKRHDLRPELVDLARGDPGDVEAALLDARVLVVSGGDPFALLALAGPAGMGEAAEALLRRDGLYVGMSAGAMLAGPSLEPATLTSPFAPPPGLDLRGLGLTDVCVLPHADHPGRAERIAEAERRYGERYRLVPLRDGASLVLDA